MPPSPGNSLPSRPETPSRTLVNPVLGRDGSVVVAIGPSDTRLTITPDSGVGGTEVTVTRVTSPVRV